MRPDDFRVTVDLACIRFGLEVDVCLWEVFVHGDKTTRRRVSQMIGQNQHDIAHAFAEEQFAKTGLKQQEEIPPELLERMNQLILNFMH